MAFSMRGAKIPTFSSPVIAKRNLYFATMGGNVFALEAGTGKIGGYTLTEDRVRSMPWIEDGAIYVGDNGGFIYAMRAGSQLSRRIRN